MDYTRAPISPVDAVERLALKGLTIHDRVKAEKIIQFVGYFRLRGYCLPFMQSAPPGHAHGTRVFQNGTTWDHVQQAYECDRVIRNAIAFQLERIEVAFRAVLVDHMAHKYSACFYSDLTHGFADAMDHMDWLIDSMKEIKRSGEHPIKHYFKTYKNPPLPPSWYVTEAITFTRWSVLYSMLSTDKGAIAKPFGIPPDILDSWMHALSVLRNMCAHHSRLFGKNLTLQPAKFKKRQIEFVKPNSVYTQIAVIQILIATIDGNRELHRILQDLPTKYPLIDLETFYGVRPDWYLGEIWRE